MSQNIKVVVRVRPSQGDRCIECDGASKTLVLPRVRQQYLFDGVCDEKVTQQEVFEVVEPLINTFLDGYNATIFAYGQTGSGKTHTMGSAATSADEHSEEAGILPRVIQQIFPRLAEREQESGSAVEMVVSFLEIYNEELVDLLSDSTAIRVVEDPRTKAIALLGATEERVGSAQEAFAYLEQGSYNRRVASTSMNATSSRSHAIFTLSLVQRGSSETEEAKSSKFHFVDLAGSERAKRTQATGARMREGCNINAGLLALSHVISALTSDHVTHVPYRDSKLTRLLQDSLGGNSSTVMIACVSGSDDDFAETRNTLQYASRARNIKNTPVVNKAGTLEQRNASLLRQNEQLLRQVEMLRSGSAESQLVLDLQAEVAEWKQRCLAEKERANRIVEAQFDAAAEQVVAAGEKFAVVHTPRSGARIKREVAEPAPEVEPSSDAPGAPETTAARRSMLHEMMEGLEPQLDELEASGLDVEHDPRLVELLEQSAAAHQKHSAARSSAACADRDIASYQSMLLGSQQRLTQTEEAASSVAARMSDMQAQLESEKQERQKLQTQLEAAQTATGKAPAPLKKALAERDRRIEQIEMQNRRLQMEKDRLAKLQQESRNSIHSLEAQLQRSRTEKVKFQKAQREQEQRHKTTLQKRDEFISAMRKRDNDLSRQSQRESREKKALQRKKESLEARVQMLLALSKRRNSARSYMGAKSAQTVAAAQEMLKQKLRQYRELHVHCYELHEKKDTLTCDLARLRCTAVVDDTESEDACVCGSPCIKPKVAAAQAAVVAAEKEVAQVAAELSSEQQQVQQLNKELQECWKINPEEACAMMLDELVCTSLQDRAVQQDARARAAEHEEAIAARDSRILALEEAVTAQNKQFLQFRNNLESLRHINFCRDFQSPNGDRLSLSSRENSPQRRKRSRPRQDVENEPPQKKRTSSPNGSSRGGSGTVWDRLLADVGARRRTKMREQEQCTQEESLRSAETGWQRQLRSSRGS
mmetsp:Transcript_36828/g.84268  ORF Transcript_36828/g.84268 Transcript_36828/m.84268 type:complete len:991 (-) Transcript_36828:191-3163(-)